MIQRRADVEAVVQVAIGGGGFTQMVEGEKKFDIVLRLPVAQRDDPEVIGRIPVNAPAGPDGKPGARIPLKQLANIEPHKPGATYIYRENNRRYIPIKFSVQGRDLASTIHEAEAKVTDPKYGAMLPKGYNVDWAGEFAQMQQANERLMYIVPISIGLILVLLYTAFNSMKDALLVMANVVAATMGGVWALKLTGTPFSISAAVGFISIFGVAVQDGVLLISYFNQMRAAGLPVKEALLAGRRAAGPPRRHDLADRRPGALPGRDRQLDRLAGAEAPGHRRGRRHARDPVPDPLSHARAVFVLPGTRRPRAIAESELIMGSHYTDRFLQPSAATRHALDEAADTTTASTATAMTATRHRRPPAISEAPSHEDQLETRSWPSC